MSNIFLIGATGGVGHRLVPMLIERGHTVTGLHRKPEQAEALRQAGVTPALGDIIDLGTEELEMMLQGSDVAVFSAGAAGSGWERTTAIDGKGPLKLIEAARKTGLRRIYLVSVFPDAGRTRDTSDGFEHYMEQKKMADAALADTGLDYVILRPGTLQHDDGNGKVRAGHAIPYGNVARGNVASLLAELIDTPDISREIIEVTDGDVPVAEAVEALRRS